MDSTISPFLSKIDNQQASLFPTFKDCSDVLQHKFIKVALLRSFLLLSLELDDATGNPPPGVPRFFASFFSFSCPTVSGMIWFWNLICRSIVTNCEKMTNCKWETYTPRSSEPAWITMARPAMSLNIKNQLIWISRTLINISIHPNLPYSPIAKGENSVNEIDVGLPQNRRCNVSKIPGMALLLIAGENHLSHTIVIWKG